MENQGIKILVLALFFLIPVTLFSQKELISDPDKVEERVVSDLNEHLESDEWKKWIEKNPIKGQFAFDITVYNKGEVVAVRALGRSGEATIPDQNKLKDYLKTMKFKFKVPKGKRYKVTYSFNLE